MTPNTDNNKSFASLSLRKELLQNLNTLNFNAMTDIQAQSLPVMLNGHDVIAEAKTGSGKTAAFGLTLLNRLQVDQYVTQTLILCPTRELAEQVSQVIRKLARLLPNVKVLNLSGGMPMKPQLDSLRHGAHIIVGTPGRVLKHLEKDTLSLQNITTLVLDEADRMLDMGFIDPIRDIIAACPKPRQTLLFSATYPAEIKQLAAEFLHKPKHIVIHEQEEKLDIEQRFFEAKNQAVKFELLITLLQHYQPERALVFCNTKELTTKLASQLNKEGYSAIALNGDMEQYDRDLAVIRFSNQSCSFLVATDVAARGLDIKELPAVINYELAFERDVHIHRIGRTGRAGSKGLALSLTTPADAERLVAIEDHLKQPLIFDDVHKLTPKSSAIVKPEMVTLALGAGRKDKIRPGDILGALTKDAGIAGHQVGKIDVGAIYSYVAIHHSAADKAYQALLNGKLKGRRVDVKKLR